MPAACAQDFRAFCEANPKPCPVLTVGEPGSPFFPTLGQYIDVRTDVPRYGVRARSRGRAGLEPDVTLVRRSRGLRAWLLVLLRPHSCGRSRASATRVASFERSDVADDHPNN